MGVGRWEVGVRKMLTHLERNNEPLGKTTVLTTDGGDILERINSFKGSSGRQSAFYALSGSKNKINMNCIHSYLPLISK